MSKFKSPWRHNTPGARPRKHRGYRGGPPMPGQFMAPLARVGADGHRHVRMESATHPAPQGGAGQHFPSWVSREQAKNHLSINDFMVRFPDVAKRMAADKRYMPDKAIFKKVRSLGSHKWGLA